jgi:hypothetical protein
VKGVKGSVCQVAHNWKKQLRSSPWQIHHQPLRQRPRRTTSRSPRSLPRMNGKRFRPPRSNSLFQTPLPNTPHRLSHPG